MLDITDCRLAPYVSRAEKIYGPTETATFILVLVKANDLYSSRPYIIRKIDEFLCHLKNMSWGNY
ncbi:protein of unknown function [Hyphomicrobium sp. MC1]|nr:protein of unknown function [Hyphomicrobium sp. MC1]